MPFRRDSAYHIVRARDREDGTIEHLLVSKYHGDPIRAAGCYYHFGWELLDDMSRPEFRNPHVCLYWSRDFCYFDRE
jgi:hypothetical protein